MYDIVSFMEKFVYPGKFIYEKKALLNLYFFYYIFKLIMKESGGLII